MIRIVDGKPYLDQVKALILEYTQWLNRDLSFQNLDKELADIAEKYTAPNGELLVALSMIITWCSAWWRIISIVRAVVK